MNCGPFTSRRSFKIDISARERSLICPKMYDLIGGIWENHSEYSWTLPMTTRRCKFVDESPV